MNGHETDSARTGAAQIELPELLKAYQSVVGIALDGNNGPGVRQEQLDPEVFSPAVIAKLNRTRQDAEAVIKQNHLKEAFGISNTDGSEDSFMAHVLTAIVAEVFLVHETEDIEEKIAQATSNGQDGRKLFEGELLVASVSLAVMMATNELLAQRCKDAPEMKDAIDGLVHLNRTRTGQFLDPAAPVSADVFSEWRRIFIPGV